MAWFVAASLVACFSCSKKEDDGLGHHDHRVHEEKHDSETHHEDEHEGHEHGAGNEIVLAPEQAKQFNVQTETVTPGTFYNIIKATGQIMESPEGTATVVAPTAGTVNLASGIVPGVHVARAQIVANIKAGAVTGGDANAVALNAVKAAQREVDRLRPLHEKGVVSTADFNRALAALDAAKAAYSPSAASGRAVAPIAGTITNVLVGQGQFVEAGSAIATISANNNVVLQALVPQKYAASTSQLSGALIKTPYSKEIIDLSQYGATRTAPGIAATAHPGYIPVYFTFANKGEVIPGTFVEVFLTGAPKENVITVPLSAISEQQGNYFVYIQVDEEGYLKSPVTLGQNDGTRVEILSGVHQGDKVVTQGVTAVKLAENSTVVPEGHSHNH